MKKWILLALCCCAGLLRAQSAGPVCKPELFCLPGDSFFFTVPEGTAKAKMDYQVSFTSATSTLQPIPLVPLAKVPDPGMQKMTDCAQPVLPPADVVPAGFCALQPKGIPDGVYTVKITEKTSNTQLTGVSPAQIVVQHPVITAVWPEGSFLETATANTQTNKIVVLGKGFRRGDTSPVKPDTGGTSSSTPAQTGNLSLHFPYSDTPNKCADRAKNTKKTNCYEILANSDQQVTLTFYGVSAGPRVFTLVLDGSESNESTLALINAGADFPLTAAVMVVVLIALLIYIILRSGKHATKQKMNGKEYWLTALFLDVPTNTYSLSKCQFYAWTAAAVFGYIFLAVSKSVVQGSGVFPDIPPGLPGIILASVGTVVVSQGIASAKGDKGAGNPGPNLSDFISTGGVIAADRLQFAVWTIIGIGTFLSLVIQTDPRKINDLPAIPSGFMQLMGISSAGYLAGKLVRKPGPTIANVTARYTKVLNPPPDPPANPPQGQPVNPPQGQPANPPQGQPVNPPQGQPANAPPAQPANAPPAQPANAPQAQPAAKPVNTLRFEITGACLSRSALFFVGDQQIFPDLLVGDNGLKGPQILKPDPSNNDPDLASVLTFSVPNPPVGYLGQHPFTIINPDAQKAVKDYQVFNIKDVAVSNSAQTITVTGECLGPNLMPTCPGCGEATPADNNTENLYVWRVNPVPAAGTPVTVTFADGSAGGKLDWQTTVKA